MATNSTVPPLVPQVQLTPAEYAHLASQDHGPLLLRVVWVLTALSSIVLLGRLWAKLLRTNRLYWDDWLMMVAMVLGLLYAAFISVGVHYGMGRHLVLLQPHDIEKALKMGIAALAWGLLSPVIGRIAFCVTMLYLVGTDKQVSKWPIWLFIVLQVVVNVVVLTLFASQCGPNHMYYLWDQSKWMELQTQCWNFDIQTKLGYFQGSFNTVTDLFLTILPAILIKHTQLSLSKKLGLVCLLCLSIIAMTASIVKTYYAKALSEKADYTFDLWSYAIWIAIESNIVIIVASVPLFRSLFSRRYRQQPAHEHRPSYDNITLNSVFSKKNPRAATTHLSTSSEENIIPTRDLARSSGNRDIHVMTEVSVSYGTSNAPFVHAALVGLVQGEISNPRLAR